MAGAVQMNVRIDPALKQRGDAIFQKQGITPSQAVRCLWEYAAEHGSVPDFMCGTATTGRDEELRRKLALVEKYSGYATRATFPGPAGRSEGPSADEVVHACRHQDDIYDEMLDDLHAMYAEYQAEHA